MIRTIVLTLIILSIAVGGGTASVWYMLNSSVGFGAVRNGVWVAYPAAGTPRADPYSTARRARDAELPLGAAEGLAFYARTDSTGRALSGRCNYRIVGNVPVARFWTFHVADNQLNSLTKNGLQPQALHSRQILRRPDGSFVLRLGPDPAPGNWMRISLAAPVAFVLTLYDTPVTSTTGAEDQVFPEILRSGCV